MDPFAGFSSDPMSLHKFLYAHGDPTNLADPSGYVAAYATEFAIAAGIAATLALAADAILDVWAPRSESVSNGKFGVWDAVATTQLRGAVSSQAATQTGVAAAAASPRAHHTIPVYLCGDEPNQEKSVITHAEHVAIHAQLAAIAFVIQGAEAYATDVVGRHRSENIVLRIARTEEGRGAIANAIDQTYYWGGWWSRGLPPIKDVFERERGPFVRGEKTSLPWCSRDGMP